MEKILVLIHPLNIIDIINFFNYKPRFNGIFSRNNLPKVNNGAYVISVDDEKSKETNWISIFIYRNTAVYLASFGVEYIPQEVLNKTKDKSITHNIFRI